MGVFSKKGDEVVLTKLSNAPEAYRTIGMELHHVIMENGPELEPIIRWGLPFYTKDGKDVCYIKIGTDFIAFGFSESLNPAFESGATMHPLVWNITSLDDATKARIGELVKKAVSSKRTI